MLRNRLKDLDLKITELADYLQISRPTMYKFIEYYDDNEFDLINKKVLKLFNYINENELIGKKNVINFILSNLVELKSLDDPSDDTIKKIRKLIHSNPESKRIILIKYLINSKFYDNIISYLIKVNELSNKNELTKDDENYIEPYKNFINELKERNII